MTTIAEIKSRVPKGSESLVSRELRELEKLERKQVELLELQLAYKRKHGAEFFRPYWYQSEFIELLHAGKKICILQGSNQSGKEQPVDSKVCTPNGFVSIGSLVTGDWVIGEDGSKYRVRGVYPQGIKPVYRMTFNDGSIVESGLEHLWKVRMPSKRFRKQTRHGNKSPSFERWEVKTLKEIFYRFGMNPKPYQRVAIPMCQPVNFETTYVPVIHPYLLGVLIGYGSLTHGIGFSTGDIELIEYIKGLLPEWHEIRYKDKYDWTITGLNEGGLNGRTNIILNEIRALGLNVKSESKFIPYQYKYLSPEQRIELLRGLIDTDGSISEKCQIEFGTMSKQLALDVQWLVQSLGGQAKLREKHFKYQYKDNPEEDKTCYRLVIRIEGINPFKLKRKAERYYKTKYRKERILYNIEYVGHKECVCISVDSKDHTYLTDNFIVTHNTLTGSALVESFCSGVQPWDGRQSIFSGRPTKGRIICTSWEAHAKETLVPKLKETLFIDDYETSKNNVGVEAFWKHKRTGSQFTIMCQSQETFAFESDTYDWCWSDEPLEKAKYTASMRGLVAREGVFMMTMTSLSQAWIYRELYQQMNDESKKIGCVVGINIRENKSLTEEAIKRFEDACDENEKVARIEGGWLQLTGLVWPQFSRTIHVIKPFKIPPSWPVVVLIDPHWSMPFVACYYAVSPLGRRYQIKEDWCRPNPEYCAEEIVRAKKENSWRLQRCYIDPLGKSETLYDRNNPAYQGTVKTQMQKVLNPFGILIDDAERSEQMKANGLTNIGKWLMEEWGEPSLFFFNTCQKSIEEIEQWGKDKNGNPIDEDDHACENLYRFSLTNTKYTDPSETFDFAGMKGTV